MKIDDEFTAKDKHIMMSIHDEMMERDSKP